MMRSQQVHISMTFSLREKALPRRSHRGISHRGSSRHGPSIGTIAHGLENLPPGHYGRTNLRAPRVVRPYVSRLAAFTSVFTGTRSPRARTFWTSAPWRAAGPQSPPGQWSASHRRAASTPRLAVLREDRHPRHPWRDPLRAPTVHEKILVLRSSGSGVSRSRTQRRPSRHSVAQRRSLLASSCQRSNPLLGPKASPQEETTIEPGLANPKRGLYATIWWKTKVIVDPKPDR